jgi:hypothetical protein
MQRDGENPGKLTGVQNRAMLKSPRFLKRDGSGNTLMAIHQARLVPQVAFLSGEFGPKPITAVVVEV